LEIKPRRRGHFKTIHGEVVEGDIGVTGVKYDGQEAIVEVVFAVEGDAEVLGVTNLESLGYRVNSITEELEYVGLLAIYRTTIQRLSAIARASETLEIVSKTGNASLSGHPRAPHVFLAASSCIIATLISESLTTNITDTPRTGFLPLSSPSLL